MAVVPSSYIELHAASAFSFLQGASLPEALVDRAADLGYSAIALVDRDGIYGAPRFHKAAKRAGLHPIIGAELTITGAGGPGEAGNPGRAGQAGPGCQVPGTIEVDRLVGEPKRVAAKEDGGRDSRDEGDEEQQVQHPPPPEACRRGFSGLVRHPGKAAPVPGPGARATQRPGRSRITVCQAAISPARVAFRCGSETSR